MWWRWSRPAQGRGGKLARRGQPGVEAAAPDEDGATQEGRTGHDVEAAAPGEDGVMQEEDGVQCDDGRTR